MDRRKLNFYNNLQKPLEKSALLWYYKDRLTLPVSCVEYIGGKISMDEKLFNSELKVMDVLRREGEYTTKHILTGEQNKKGGSV